MENNNENICQFLEWDSAFFGFRIARVNGNTLTNEQLSEIIEWCRIEKIACLYFLADSSDLMTLASVQSTNFRFVDIRITLEKKNNLELSSNQLDPEIAVRTARDSDIPQLRQLAGLNHTASRFYYDEHFPKGKCDELYATWIEKSCNGYADVVFVAESQNEILGYISCSLRNGVGNIGLVGVKASAQGRGIGKFLVNHACRWLMEKGTNKTTIVTQGRNIIAQRLYQKNGFITESIKIWYHLWLNN